MVPGPIALILAIQPKRAESPKQAFENKGLSSATWMVVPLGTVIAVNRMRPAAVPGRLRQTQGLDSLCLGKGSNYDKAGFPAGGDGQFMR
jgi:hypothetical protein